MNRIFLLNSKRTAIGKFLGSFYECNVIDVCSQLTTELLKGFAIEDIDETILGNVVSAGLGQGVARAIAINSGIPIEKPAYTVGMVCGSGMQAIINGVKSIKCGNKLELVGGLEFMSNIPYATDSYIRLGKKFGDFTMMDLMVHDGLTDAFSGVHMGITAENIAKDLNITREEQDKYSYLAQQRAIRAVDNGEFKDEIVPIKLKDWKKREYVFEIDEFPNRESTPEKLSSLKPTFIKDGTGTVTAGSSSGINDGASFMLIASEEYCKEKGLKPAIEIVETASVGCDPQKMGLGPYYAISKLLEKANIDFKDIDVFEINEAFAAQILGCHKMLAKKFGVTIDYMIERTNVNGSGLALGHPLGASGARIVTTLAHYMEKHDVKYGIASLCIGGGQGTAILLKR